MDKIQIVLDKPVYEDQLLGELKAKFPVLAQAHVAILQQGKKQTLEIISGKVDVEQIRKMILAHQGPVARINDGGPAQEAIFMSTMVPKELEPILDLFKNAFLGELKTEAATVRAEALEARAEVVKANETIQATLIAAKEALKEEVGKVARAIVVHTNELAALKKSLQTIEIQKSQIVTLLKETLSKLE